MSTGRIIDIAIVAIVLISIIIGAIRGLFKSFIGVVIAVVAVFGAILLSGVLADTVTEKVYPRYQDKLQKLVDEPSLHLNIGAILENGTDSAIDNFLSLEISSTYFDSGIPEEILKIANQFGFEKEDLQKPLQSALESAQKIVRDYRDSGSKKDADLKQAVEDASVAAQKAFLRPIVRAVLIIVLFILLVIILNIVAGVINKLVKKTPGVKQVNAFGGALLSFVEICVLMYLLLTLAVRFGLTVAYEETVHGSFILDLVLNFIPK